MSGRNEPIDPIEPELAALLARERAAAPPPAAALARVWTSVKASLVDGARAGDSHGEDWVAAHARKLIALAFVVGGAVGAGAHAIARPAPRDPGVATAGSDAATPRASARMPGGELGPASPESPAPPAIAAPEAPRPPGVATTSAVPPAQGAAAASPGRAASAASSLSAERSLLDRARAALTGGDAQNALALADEHARRFIPAQLAEEREALAIQALAVDGRYADARGRALRFRATWPDSLFLPAISATLASIP
jgi:hypothetical protein